MEENWAKKLDRPIFFALGTCCAINHPFNFLFILPPSSVATS